MDLPSPHDSIAQTGYYEFSDIRDRIEGRLAELLPEDPQGRDTITQAMREAVLAGGKRVRSILLVLAARGLDRDTPALFELGCAVEMVHTASLILDDMPCMDNASMRRGRATVHLRFGEDVAILAAVALLTRAFELVSTAPGVPAAIRTEMVALLAEAVGMQGLVRGQYEDLQEGGKQRSAAAVTSTNRLKTALLFEAPVRMAALVAGAPDTKAGSLRSFALELGHAFQLLDDLGDESTANGKDAGQDRGKTTLLALLGTDQVRLQLAAHLAEGDRHLAAVYGQDQAISRFVRGLFGRFDMKPASNIWPTPR